MTQNLNVLSEQLLLRVKKREASDELRQQIARISQATLRAELTTDEQRLAFWINIYNAFFLYLRRDAKVDKPAIYRERLVPFADVALSLDEIEHGILRRCRAKWALGYLPSPGFRWLVRRLMVKQADYRIHFALNCGAQSCPPIAFYKPARVDEQLELATASFLEQETIVDEVEESLQVSQLFRWYLGDFGGQRGTRRILVKYLNLRPRPWRISYRPYNWEENLANFV